MDFNTFMEIIRRNKIVTEQQEFDTVSNLVPDIFDLIYKFVSKHGNIALSCGSEWMYQDDEGQVDALSLVGKILDKLNVLAAEESEDDE